MKVISNNIQIDIHKDRQIDRQILQQEEGK